MLGQDDCSIFLAYAEQMEHPDRKKEEFGEKGALRAHSCEQDGYRQTLVSVSGNSTSESKHRLTLAGRKGAGRKLCPLRIPRSNISNPFEWWCLKDSSFRAVCWEMAIKGSALLGCQIYKEAHVGQGPGCILGWHQKVVLTIVISNLAVCKSRLWGLQQCSESHRGLAIGSRDGISAESS